MGAGRASSCWLPLAPTPTDCRSDKNRPSICGEGTAIAGQHHLGREVECVPAPNDGVTTPMGTSPDLPSRRAPNNGVTDGMLVLCVAYDGAPHASLGGSHVSVLARI